jgi:predicted ATPase/DNA-binding SARP family transcriptional activator
MNEACSITLFGGLQVQQGDRRIARFRTYKTGALLAYLAFYTDVPHSREVLAELFWPESEAGRISLRVAAGSLRHQLEPPGTASGAVLVATRTSLSLNPSAVRIDVPEFEAALRSAALVAPPERMERLVCAVELYRGPLLPGYYEEWILPERERLAEMYVGALHQLCALLETAEDLNAALDYGHRAVIAAPFREDAHVTLMRLYLLAERPTDALRHYDALERALVTEWGDSGAMPAANALAAEIRRRPRGKAPGNVPATRPAVKARKNVPLPSPTDTQAVTGRLPRPYTRLFGREEEIACLQRLCLPFPSALSPPSVLPTRLITITGPGGMGKTRLAIEVARRCSEALSTRVWFVSLADLVDPRLMPDAIAMALGVSRAALADPTEQIFQALSAHRSLLILDNIEHLLAENLVPSVASTEGRTVVQGLLDSVLGLTILVTSRQSLEIEGETPFPLSSLPVPTPGILYEAASDPIRASMPDVPGLTETVVRLSSVQMFVDRAQSVRPDFQLTPRNAAAIATLCSRLEGVPLFIELAAAWAQTYTPAQMLSHLDSDRLLVSRRKDRPGRHISVCAVVDWSFQLLNPLLRRFFARLSVFAGGWTLEAAAEICEEAEALSALGELHARSMIVAEEQGEAMRYRLPEALRRYAADQLHEEEHGRLAERHAAVYLRIAEQAEHGLSEEEQKAWLERMAPEQDNLRAALAWGRSRDVGLRLAGALCTFWEIRGEVVEGRRWLAAALGSAVDAPAVAHARALAGAARFAVLQGDFTEARAVGDASWREFRALQEDRAAASVGTLLSRVYHLLGETDVANALLADCLALGRRDGASRELAAALTEQGRRHGFYGDYDLADACLLESRDLTTRLGDMRGVAQVAFEQAIIQQYRQDFPASNDFYEQALALCNRLGDRVGSSEALYGIGYVAWLRGDLSLAAATLEAFLVLQRQMVLKVGILTGLRILGCVVRDQGDYKRAMGLFEEALTMARACGERQMVAETLGSMGIVAHYGGNYRKARVWHEQCLQFRRESGYRQDIAESLGHLALLALAEGDAMCARTLLGEGLALFREIGVPIGIATLLSWLSLPALLQGKIEEAAGACLESLMLLKTASGPRETIDALEQAARVAHARGADVQAACLLSASEALRRHFGFRRYPFSQTLCDRLAAALQSEMEPEALSAARNHGAKMTLSDAVDYALEMSGRDVLQVRQPIDSP